jgi:hypothetical protein
VVNAVELEFNRVNTTAYIAADPSVIALARTTRVADGAGGFTKSAPTPQAEQIFRIVNGQISQMVARTVDGKEIKADYMMICQWNANVAAGDTFVTTNCKYLVTYVYPDPTYELLAEVAFVGVV